jgi:hypothetical protein
MAAPAVLGDLIQRERDSGLSRHSLLLVASIPVVRHGNPIPLATLHSGRRSTRSIVPRLVSSSKAKRGAMVN